MELNREQIIEDWEAEVALGKDIGLKRDFINYVSISLVNATLSLIKELTKEVEDWKAIAEQYQKQFEDCYEENERLRASSIDYRNIPIITDEARADTVQKMRDMLKREFLQYDEYDELYIKTVRDCITFIAQEVLGDGNGYKGKKKRHAENVRITKENDL